MVISQQHELDKLLDEHLRPLIREIDQNAFYPSEVLKAVGKAGLLSSEGLTLRGAAAREIEVVKRVSQYCMTTGFNLWCHLAALTYIRHTANNQLRERVLPSLENGGTLGGTGLSNPMKYYAGLEKLHLKAEQGEGGIRLNGTLPAVSNLGEGHWFGVIAELPDDKRIMALISCEQKGLRLKEKLSYLGLNGSATFSCCFDNVFIPDSQVLSDDADSFVKQIRPYFVAYQIPLGIGVAKEALRSMKKYGQKQEGCNRYLPVQPEDIEEKLTAVETELGDIFAGKGDDLTWLNLLSIRKKCAYMTLEAVNAAMLHAGGAAYLKNSPDARRLRETYFFLNLTPTVKHLEKMLSHQ